MNLYINQGRFGEFVSEIVRLENDRIIAEAEQIEQDRWFELYLRSGSDKSFNDWKKEVIANQPEQNQSLLMTDEQIQEQYDKSKEILKKINMKG